MSQHTLSLYGGNRTGEQCRFALFNPQFPKPTAVFQGFGVRSRKLRPELFQQSNGSQYLRPHLYRESLHKLRCRLQKLNFIFHKLFISNLIYWSMKYFRRSDVLVAFAQEESPRIPYCAKDGASTKCAGMARCTGQAS